MIRAIKQEFARGSKELDRLRTLDRRRVPIPAALVGSVFVVVLGNGVVLGGRQWCQPEWITLVGVPVIGLLGVFLMGQRGWQPSDLGLQGLKWEPATACRWLVWLAVVLGVGSAAFALFRERISVLDAATLFIGTAIGEEIVHRGVVLGAWAATGIRAAWVVMASMITFALWHVAGANKKSGFKWFDVIGPAALALPLLWARLRFRSVLAAAAFHGAANMTVTAAT